MADETSERTKRFLDIDEKTISKALHALVDGTVRGEKPTLSDIPNRFDTEGLYEALEMIDYVLRAVHYIERGQYHDAATCVRLARDYEDEIYIGKKDTPSPLALRINGDFILGSVHDFDLSQDVMYIAKKVSDACEADAETLIANGEEE